MESRKCNWGVGSKECMGNWEWWFVSGELWVKSAECGVVNEEWGVGHWEKGTKSWKCLESGVWCVVCGVWCVVCGVWCAVCGAWCAVCGVWCEMCCMRRVYRFVVLVCGGNWVTSEGCVLFFTFFRYFLHSISFVLLPKHSVSLWSEFNFEYSIQFNSKKLYWNRITVEHLTVI